MRILLLVDCYLPSPKSSAKLMHDLAEEMTRQGHEVLLACPDDTLSTPVRCDEGGPFTVLRIKTPQIKGASKIWRAIHEAQLSRYFWSQGRSYFEKQPCDLIVYYSPTIFFGDLVRRLKALWNCPSYLILRDIFPQWAVDAGVMRKGLAYWFFRWAERYQYQQADTIGVQSPANLDYFAAQPELAAHCQLEVLMNWAPVDEAKIPRTDFRRQWELDDKLILFYGGNLGVAQDVMNLVRLAENVRDLPTAHLLLVGNGSEVPKLCAAIRDRGLSNITWKPAVGQSEYLGLLQEVDIGLVSLDRQLKTQNFPGKMLGYFATGIPLLASINPGNDLERVVGEAEAGLVCHNGDDDGFAARARQLLLDPLLRARIGRNGRQLLASTFSVETAARQITSHIENVQRTARAA